MCRASQELAISVAESIKDARWYTNFVELLKRFATSCTMSLRGRSRFGSLNGNGPAAAKARTTSRGPLER